MKLNIKLNTEFYQSDDYITSSQLVAEFRKNDISNPEAVKKEILLGKETISNFIEEIFLSVGITEEHLKNNIEKLHQHFYTLIPKVFNEFMIHQDASVLNIFAEHRFRISDEQRVVGFKVVFGAERKTNS